MLTSQSPPFVTRRPFEILPFFFPPPSYAAIDPALLGRVRTAQLLPVAHSFPRRVFTPSPSSLSYSDIVLPLLRRVMIGDDVVNHFRSKAGLFPDVSLVLFTSSSALSPPNITA